MSWIDRFVSTLHIPTRKSLVIELFLMALGVGLAILFAVVLLEDKPPGVEPASLTMTLALIVPALLVLLGRRRWPLTICLISGMLLSAIRLLDVPELQISSITIVIGFFAAGRYGAPVRRDIVRGVVVLMMIAIIAWEARDVWSNLARYGLTERFFLLSLLGGVAANIVLFVATWFAGDAFRRRVEREKELAARTLELEMSREENARRAVMDERVRIAREIHDVVAHHVSVMGLQAGVARQLSKSDSADIGEPLLAIEESSRQAVTELHRLLGFLRRVDETDPDGLSADALTPIPGLHRLPDLRSQLAGAGLALHLEITGEERDLPPSVDLNAYRILQEALTNCLKYAGVDSADVLIDYGTEQLSLAILDRGRGPNAEPSMISSGSGLPGMAERVALLGGTLHHGPRTGGGFEVRATLPYEGHSSAAPSATVPEAVAQ